MEAHLLEAWQAHDSGAEPLVGAAAATTLAGYLCSTGRLEEALIWGERAVAASAGDPAARLHALIAVALSLTIAGCGREGLARLNGLPAVAAEIPLEHTDAIIARGMCRLFTDDMTGAVTDLSVGLARLRTGVSLQSPGQCLVYLTDAEYRLGDWDDALIHSALAVSLAHDADRTTLPSRTACGAEVRPGPEPARWNLTASEMAVARLVATGRSNREVAAELYVSVKAVEYHLGHVFDKIGIRSRRALPSRLAASVSEP